MAEKSEGASVWVIVVILAAIILALWFYPSLFKGMVTGAFHWVKAVVAP